MNKSKSNITDFSRLSYSVLFSVANDFFPENRSVSLAYSGREYWGHVRIIDNVQSPFIRAVYNEDGYYNVVYYTVLKNIEYCLQYINYKEDYIINEKTLQMLDNIVLSINFN